ncbi:hypothetical protein ADS46_10950 [Halomonas sp. G11]|nr:hypothetical protein ADS46_10950 [Halomonas sp. G11]
MDAINFLEKNSGNQMVKLYPQVIVACFLAFQDKLYWFGLPLTKKEYQLDSKIVDSNGLPYADIGSRITQFQCFDKILSEMILSEIKVNKKNNKIVKKLKKENFYLMLSILEDSMPVSDSRGFSEIYEIRLQSYIFLKLLNFLRLSFFGIKPLVKYIAGLKSIRLKGGRL